MGRTLIVSARIFCDRTFEGHVGGTNKLAVGFFGGPAMQCDESQTSEVGAAIVAAMGGLPAKLQQAHTGACKPLPKGTTQKITLEIDARIKGAPASDPFTVELAMAWSFQKPLDMFLPVTSAIQQCLGVPADKYPVMD
jgi:hypothetical protein